MKRLGLRVAAVATVLIVGVVVAIQAQRNAEKPAIASETGMPRTVASNDTARPILDAHSQGNPLRGDLRSPMNDPFALPAAATTPVETPAAMPEGDIPNAADLPTPMINSADEPGYAPPRSMPPIPPAMAAGDDDRPLPIAMPGAMRSSRPSAGPADYAPPGGATAPFGIPPARALTPDDAARPSSPMVGRPDYAPTPLNDAPSSDAPPGAARDLAPIGTLPALPASDRMPASRPSPLDRPGLSELSPPPGLRSELPPADVAMGGAAEGMGRPGGKHLEGPQTPQLLVQKLAPPEVQVGKAATFTIKLRNTGTVPATGVEIHDQIPRGAKVLSTNPRASQGVRGDLVWTLGTVKPGDEVSVEVQLMPMAEGEIGSVATVQFSADASARTIATKPQLVVETTMPERVQIGEQVALRVTVSNPGTGVATGVIVEEHIPAGLQHSAGADLEYEIGELKPGESRTLDLVLTAMRAGAATNILNVRAEGNLRAEDRKNIEVTAPQLAIALEGPRKRYLEREATYQVSISNPGTAPAQHVELVAQLPSGLQFVSANNAGHYDESSRAVVWRLEELPVNETGAVELVTLPVEAGEQTLKLRTSADRGISAEHEQPVLIEGIAAIHFQAADTVDPVEVGGETTYEVRVLNQGSKAASNVAIVVQLPPEMKMLAAEGPSRYEISGNQVVFEGLSRLAPKADTTYRIRVQALRAGDLRTRIQLMTDEMQTPVTKEESTRVYADE